MVLVREVPGIPLRHFIIQRSKEESELSISELITLSVQTVALTQTLLQPREVSAVPCLLAVEKPTKSTDIQPTCACFFLSFSPFSVFAVLNRPTCVSGKQYPYTQ